MVSKAHILWLFSILLSFGAAAQEYRFYVQADKKKVSLGRRVQLTYKFQGGTPTDFTPPQLKNFSFTSAISQGYETRTVNGRMSKAYTFQFTVKPKSVGQFTIPPARVTVDGRELESDEITIKVIDKTDEERDIQEQIAENLYIKVYASKTEVYLGEQIKVTFKLYKRVDLTALDYKSIPSYDGFWKEVLSDKKDFQLQNEVIDGIQYQTGILESVILFPQKSGELVIDPYVLHTKVPVRKQGRGRRSFFDDFFGNYVNYEYDLSSPILKIRVKPLPAGKPGDFSGLVGKFGFEADLTTTQLEVGDPITLNIIIRGEGNLKLLKPWDVEFPTGIEDHPAQTHDKITTSGGVMRGSRRYEYLMVPYRDGIFKLPPISLSYFDIEKEEYVTFSNANLQFQVGKSDKVIGPATSANGSENPDEINVLNEDIEFIKFNDLQLHKKGYSPFGSTKHLALSITPFVLLLLTMFFYRRKEAEELDVVGTKKKKATTVAQKKLKAAKELMNQNNSDAFFDEVATAVFGYLSDKYAISYADMSKERALDALERDQQPEEYISMTGALIDECGFARFAPGNQAELMKTVYDKAVQVISNIESSSKK